MNKLKLWEVNTQLPSGTSVIVIRDDGAEWHTKTRSEPWQLGHGQWVVALEGKAGGYDLSRVRPDMVHT